MPAASGYQPLIDYLASWTGTSVVLTLGRIEAIIDAALPPSARRDRRWWTQTRQTQVRGWRARGWRARYYPSEGMVRFTRETEASGGTLRAPCGGR